MTGLVHTGGTQPVIDLGASLRLPANRCDVVASFFATDGLYRLGATATTKPTGLVHLAVHSVDRIQRRAHDRTRRSLPVEVSTRNGAPASVQGETVDLAPGGVRVAMTEPLALAADQTVAITLPDGQSVVALARVLEAIEHAKGFQYRIAFSDIEDGDRERLVDLTRHADFNP
jgi:hypothetical protein